MRGLSSEEVLRSREKNGANHLTPPARVKWWKLLLSKFNDPIIKLLLFATILSFISGYFNGTLTESIGILIAIFLATFLSFINEYKAGKEFDILNQISDNDPVKVLRDEKVIEIPKTEVVVGDIVFIEQGDEVPADGILLETMNLSVNESTLNGESLPARKHPYTTESDSIAEEGAYPLTKVFRGTTVMDGTGTMEVFAVGDNTEIGKTARQAAEITGDQTPLDRQLAKLGKVIAVIGFIVAGSTFLALVIRGLILGEITFALTAPNLEVLLSIFMIAVTLIVVAVPEGLAMSVTLSLAYSMRKMTASHTLVRKMHACETMGATTVICTDKTGTLTQNRMKVQYCTMEMDKSFAEQIASNSTAHLSLGSKEDEFTEHIEVVGNPTEGAMLLAIREAGLDYRRYRVPERLIARAPFSTERKYMASVVDSKYLPEGHSAHYALFLKGAAEIVLDMCNTGVTDAFDKRVIAEQIKEYQGKGMRILAFARGFVPRDSFHLDCNCKSDEDHNINLCSAEGVIEFVSKTPLQFMGFMAIADPIRDDVPPAMSACRNAGIEVKIVTGDNSLTAKEIARKSGLWSDEDGDDKIITGSEFAALSDEEAFEAALRIKVMSRARPADKMRLVTLLKKADKVVAVTGDGTNDAPALNHANVGLAMGSGTAVAKEASDIVLLNDSFASIVSAVQWGRSIYMNIQRFIQFQLTINVVALLTALIGPFIGFEFPLTVTQMLWINLIMDTFAALALATEPSDPSLLNRKPRKINDFIVNRRMFTNICLQGLTFLAIMAGLLVFFQYYSQGSELKFGFNVWIKDLSAPNLHEQSIFFTTFVMMQFWNLFNVRSSGTNRSAFYKITENKSFLLIVSVILVLQIVIVQFGGEFFRTEPLSLHEWGAIIVVTSLVLWIGEIVRGIRRNMVKNNK